VALDTRLVKDDPAGDDNGPTGLYTLPTDPSFGAQMDLRRASLVETAKGLRLDLVMGEISDNLGAPNGFDQAMFHVFIDVPGKEGVTQLPFLNAESPAGLAWDYAARIDGWHNQLYTSEGAAADSYGSEIAPATLTVDRERNTISLLFSPDPAGDIGVDAIDDVKVYITSWDWDEPAVAFRPLTNEGGPFGFGGGDGALEPLILDELVLGMATQYVSPFPPAAKVEVTWLVTVPESTPAGDDLYLTGPFNQWAPADGAYKFRRNDDGSFSLTFLLEEDDFFEYRIGRGTLANTEKLDPDDRFANRELTVPEGEGSLTIEIAVEGWWDQ